MVRETSKLILRAYNAEADNRVRSLKPFKLRSARERLDKVAFTMEKLGKTLQIEANRFTYCLHVIVAFGAQ